MMEISVMLSGSPGSSWQGPERYFDYIKTKKTFYDKIMKNLDQINCVN